MRWRFEFNKDELKVVEIDESQIILPSTRQIAYEHVLAVAQGEGNGWLLYKNVFREHSYLNLKLCKRITEVKP